MLLDVDSWITTKLTAALGASARLDYWHPNDFVNLPAVAYHTVQKNSDMGYQDDFAGYTDVTAEFDIYVANGVDDFTIAQTVYNTMAGLLFNLDSSIPIPDPDAKTQHRNMVFTRRGIAPSDLV